MASTQDPVLRSGLVPPPDDTEVTDDEGSVLVDAPAPAPAPAPATVDGPEKKEDPPHPTGSMAPPPEDTEVDEKELGMLQARAAATQATLSSASRQSMRPDIVDAGFRIPDTLSGQAGFEVSKEGTTVAFAGEGVLPDLLSSKDNPLAGVFAPKAEAKPSREELKRRLRERRRGAANARRSDAARSTINGRKATRLQKAASSKDEAEAKAAKQQIILRNTAIAVLNKSAEAAKNAQSKRQLLRAADNVYGHGMKDGLSMSGLPRQVISSVLMKAGMSLAEESPELAKELLGFGPEGPAA